MKIYTRTGDGGQTGLASGDRVLKCSQRLAAYGAVDELNAFVGLLKDQLQSTVGENDTEIIGKLLRIQNCLFDLGSELATPVEHVKRLGLKMLEQIEVSELEAEMDEWDTQLRPLKAFILPGGYINNSAAHICRTVCRRAEREVIMLAQEVEVREVVISYLNRLSDWFFILSRFLSHSANVPEVEWKNKR